MKHNNKNFSWASKAEERFKNEMEAREKKRAKKAAISRNNQTEGRAHGG